MKLEPVLDGLSFGEGPRWHEGRLWYSITHSVDLAPRGAYACMLGAEDRRTLYVVTNSGSGPAMADKCDGRIETIRVDVPGAGWP